MTALARVPGRISVEEYLEEELVSASRRIASLEEYVIVSCDPEKPEVGVFRRWEVWEPGQTVRGGEITFTSVGVTVSVDALYAALREV